ncbi:MAG: hypothetical protein HYV42_01255 [Candidatus Magasanikbacteria bacterium]|nr:hypothetical protein [Candidatus Magasanikbacteria bacterium]
MREIVEQLKRLRQGEASPRAEWVQQNRALLLSQIKNTLPARPRERVNVLENLWSRLSHYLPESLVYQVLRPALVLLVVVAVLASGAGAVDAAYETLPGDALYPVKRAAEKTQVAVATIIGKKDAATRLHMEFAKRRAVETKKLVRSETAPAKTDKVRVAMADLTSEITTVENKLEAVKQRPVNGLPAQAVKDVKQNTEEIRAVLQEVKENLLISRDTADQALSQEVNTTKNLVKDVAVKAAEAMVAKHLGGDRSVSKEEVKQELTATLRTVAQDAAATQQSVDGAKTMVQTAQSEAKELVSSTKTAGGDTTKSTELKDKITDVANQTIKAVLQNEVATAEVTKQVTEASSWLKQDDLAQAVDKLKQASDAGTQAERISDAAVSKIQEVLPAVAVVKEAISASTTLPLPVAPVTTMSSTLPTTTLPVGGGAGAAINRHPVSR